MALKKKKKGKAAVEGAKPLTALETVLMENGLDLTLQNAIVTAMDKDTQEKDESLLPNPAPESANGDIDTASEPPAVDVKYDDSPTLEKPSAASLDDPAVEVVLTQITEQSSFIQPEIPNGKDAAVNPSPPADSRLFLACIRCLEAVMVTYKGRSLPWEEGGKSLTTGIMLACCRDCEDNHTDARWDDGRIFGAVKADPIVQALRTLQLHPDIWRGPGIVDVASCISDGHIQIMTSVYKTVDQVRANLRRCDRINSIDVEGYRNGKRTELVLDHLRGGFM